MVYDDIFAVGMDFIIFAPLTSKTRFWSKKRLFQQSMDVKYRQSVGNRQTHIFLCKGQSLTNLNVPTYIKCHNSAKTSCIYVL